MAKKPIIPIVLASDDNYVPMMGTAIYSVLANASKDYFYKIYVFYTNISYDNKAAIETLKTKNSEIVFVDINEYMTGMKRESSGHLSIETIYRLFIPEILCGYDKAIYLDSDIVVLGDISEFYNMDLEGNILGAVHDGMADMVLDYFVKHLGVEAENAFNAGVLLIDTKRFIDEDIKEKCLSLLLKDWKRKEKKYVYMDQDVLNIVCRGKVKFLPMKWNYQWQYQKEMGVVAEGINKNEYIEAGKNVKLIHYAGGYKPWHFTEFDKAEYFWKYAVKTCFFKTLIKNAAECFFSEYLFPFDHVKKSSKVIIYGAGKVGKIFKSQLEITKWCKVVAWADKKYDMPEMEGMDITDPSLIPKIKYDHLIVAAEMKRVADSIKKDLAKIGVDNEKVVWEKYRHNKR